ASSAASQSESPLPVVVSSVVNGICSSGSTGVPKVILNLAQTVWTPELSMPFMAAWTQVPQPQTILVPGPMYHFNGFVTLTNLLGGDRLVVLERFDAAM
ncbi:MAG: acyl--CoA ligase, partial [Mycobacterium sp.]